MTLVSSKEISKPKLEVTPPVLLKVAIGCVLLAVLVFFVLIPMNSLIKTVILLVYGIVLFLFIKKLSGGDYLVTMQANGDGLYFQTHRENDYFHLPWEFVGKIEKALFSVNSQGIRIEVTGDYQSVVRTTDAIGNVRIDKDKMYIYTLPQLLDRDKLINNLLEFKSAKTNDNM